MPGKVLIIDDDIDTLKLVGLMLQHQGYEIMAAPSGAKGLAKAWSGSPDVILLDLMMPEMDGFAVMDRLQSDPATAEIPIIVVTAKELTSAEKNRLHGHIQGLMKKGDFLNDDLLDEVRALLG